MENFMMNTDDVIASGNEQANVAEGFNSSVANIYNIIEEICASDWKGFSAETYNNLTNEYRADMQRLGELIDIHGKNDVTSATNIEQTDQDLASTMNGSL